MEDEITQLPDGPLTIGPQEAAGLMGISREMFYKLRRWGSIGPLEARYGRLIKFDRGEFARWIQAGSPKRKEWLKDPRRSTSVAA